MQIAVTGSMAYDYLMTFPGKFREHILGEKSQALTVSFLVDSMRRLRGGVAGNVSYNLALLGERPLLLSAVGQDFDSYREFLEKAGVQTYPSKTIESDFTASCFINTDQVNSQIVAFYPGAMSHSKELSIHSLKLSPRDWVVISPTDPAAMQKYVDECCELEVPYIFDPGKQTPRLDKEQIISGIQTAAVLIGNDYEFAMMAQKTGKTEQALRSSVPLCIITHGKEGSVVYSKGKAESIPVAPISELRDPTGAGDAYLAGFTFGISRRLPLALCGRIAAVTAAYAVEEVGCQEHRFSKGEFVQRFIDAFGDSLELRNALLH